MPNSPQNNSPMSDTPLFRQLKPRPTHVDRLSASIPKLFSIVFNYLVSFFDSADLKRVREKQLAKYKEEDLAGSLEGVGERGMPCDDKVHGFPGLKTQYQGQTNRKAGYVEVDLESQQIKWRRGIEHDWFGATRPER